MISFAGLPLGKDSGKGKRMFLLSSYLRLSAYAAEIRFTLHFFILKNINWRINFPIVDPIWKRCLLNIEIIGNLWCLVLSKALCFADTEKSLWLPLQIKTVPQFRGCFSLILKALEKWTPLTMCALSANWGAYTV